mgnify:CR=1 FL=1
MFKEKVSNKNERKKLYKEVKKALLKYDYHVEIYCLTREDYYRVLNLTEDLIYNLNVDIYNQKINNLSFQINIVGSLSSVKIYYKTLEKMRGTRFTEGIKNSTIIVGKESQILITKNNKNIHWVGDV